MRDVIDAAWGANRGKVFESDVRSILTPVLAPEYPRVGGFWDRKGNEIDLVGLRPKDRGMLLVEVKAKRLRRTEAGRVLRDLQGKASIVPYEAREARLGLAAIKVEGREKLESEGHRIWELGDIVEASRRTPIDG